MNKSVTMSDVAKAMGVSTVTVSKAITGKDGVSKDVREKIKAKASEMGYIYNLGSKLEKENKEYNIGILVAERFVNDDAFYAKMHQKTIMELTNQGSFGMLEIVTWESEKNAIVPNLLSNNKVDGVILLGQLERDYIKMIDDQGIPFIFLDFYDEEFKVDSIISDSVHGAYKLTNYLISKGHKKIGYIGDYYKTSSILDRYIGYYKAMLQSRIPVNEAWILKDRGEDGLLVDIDFPKNMPTAFVCNCDEVAFMVIKKLKSIGYKVPQDVSVVGFDNFIHAQLSSPQITTFGVDIDLMVIDAVETIIKKIDNGDLNVGRIVVTGELVERDSVMQLI